MPRINFQSFSGQVTSIDDYPAYGTEDSGCQKFITVENDDGMVAHFIASPDTYFVDNKLVSIGDFITGYYDADRPMILIYPPQYPALVIVKHSPYKNVKVAYFNEQLISSDGLLQLHLTPDIPLRLTNGQAFTQNPANRNLIVSYGRTTKSIPAMTTPYDIIVYCR